VYTDHIHGPRAVDDPERLAALGRLGLPGAHGEAFDRLARLAASFLNTPVALVSLVETDRQLVAGAAGLPEPFASERAVPAAYAYCRHVVEGRKPLVVDDAREHALLREHPALHEFGAVAYLGVPIVTRAGHVLGSFCAIDSEPHEWSEAQIACLTELTASVITEIELRQEVLERTEAEQRATRILESITDAFYALDSEGRFTELNAAAERILDRTPEELLGTPFTGVVCPETLPCVEEVFRGVLAGEVDNEMCEARVLRPSGEARLLAITATAIRDEGRVTGLHGIARDVTPLAEAQEALRDSERQRRQAERLASVGTLIGGVAHELNNPLHAILNFAQLLLLDERSEDDREALEIMVREAERMAKIVADLKQIARSTQEEASERGEVDLNEVVRHVLRATEYRLRTSNIEVREDLGTDLPLVLADRAQLEQVVLNLIVNAEQAMSAHGAGRRLILRTRASTQGAALHVVDNGHGIAAHQLAHIFDPFFTTKSPGEGTGLGLSLVHSIVTEHGGEIRVDSEVGTGTAFRIDWPRTPKQQAGGASKSAEPEPEAERLRVLIVDDEAPIRTVMARYLERRGHTVHQAAEGAAALQMVQARSYDVVVSDLKMPGLDGEALMEHLAIHGLAERVIFLTGDAAGAGARLGQAGVPILLKPAKLEEVARVVEEVGRHAN
jgi:two-component system NtrC family sensor kinase